MAHAGEVRVIYRRPGPRFWFGIIIIQVMVGGGIFLLTKAHYQGAGLLSRESSATTIPVGARLPSSTAPSNSPPLAASARPVEATRAIIADANKQFAAQDYEAAARSYIEVVRREPSNTDMRNNLAISLHYAGRSAEALDAAKDGLRMAPDHQRTLLTLGFIQRATGDQANARDSLTRAVAQDASSTVGLEAQRLLQSMP